MNKFSDILSTPPFNLDEKGSEWVRETYSKMSLEEKIGQLFLLVAGMDAQEDIACVINKYHPGGFMYRPLPLKYIIKKHQEIQQKSIIPCFLAANTEAGGNGIIEEGTFVGANLQVGATNDIKYGYLLGKISGKELASVGGNLSFAPVTDIMMNFQNPVINLRSFGDQKELVKNFSSAYIKGCQEQNVAVSVKHFPGDGVDPRDQHLHTTINSLSNEDWWKTFGNNYQSYFDQGALTMMVGHFLLPNVIKELGEVNVDDINVPASFNKTILTKLVREEMHFNGLIITDATLMTGMVSYIPRKQMVPLSIAAGADVFLFTKNLDDDFEAMKVGYTSGIITEERLKEAIYRILATKAALKLHLNPFNKINPFLIDFGKHNQIAKEVREKAITLVKNEEQLLPFKEMKKVLLHYQGDKPIFADPNLPDPVLNLLISKFQKYHVEVKIIDYQNNPMQALLDTGISIKTLKEKFDAIFYFANFTPTSNSTNLRLKWKGLVGADTPSLVQEIPTIFISLGSPYHMYDVPHIKTFINAYSADELNLDILFEKMFITGEFFGKSPVDAMRGSFISKDIEIK